jgi:hypothetical protein
MHAGNNRARGHGPRIAKYKRPADRDRERATYAQGMVVTLSTGAISRSSLRLDAATR